MAFWLVLCPAGAEATLVKAVAVDSPAAKPAYRGKGLLTFKSDDALSPHELMQFCAACEGRVEPDVAAALSAQGADVYLLDDSVPDLSAHSGNKRAGDVVHTLIAERGHVWHTTHTHPGHAWTGHSTFAANHVPLTLPGAAPSRAWLKMEEVRARFVLPSPRDQRVLEFGSAPGGATFSLLSDGAYVVGVDPNEMHDRILRHPRFEHVPMPSTRLVPGEIPGPFQWLVVDVNVPPGTALRGFSPFLEAHSETLDVLIVTFKLAKWDLLEELPNWLDRVRHRVPHMRLMPWSGTHHHQEIGVVGLRRTFV